MPLITHQMMEYYQQIHFELFGVKIGDNQARDHIYKLFQLCQLAFETPEEQIPQDIRTLIETTKHKPIALPEVKQVNTERVD